MALADEAVLTNLSVAQSTEQQQEVKKEKIDVFGAIASMGELFFLALMSIINMLAAAGKKIGIAAQIVWQHVKKLLFKAVDKVAGVAIMPIIRYSKALRISRAEIRRSADEKGFAGGAAAGAKVAGRMVFGKRGIAVTVVNWALPIVSCIFLFNIISYANNQTYALKLTVNGDFVGYINDETVFTSAEKMVQKRINYTGSNTEIIVFEPTYEVEVIGYGATLNSYQVTDKILGLLYADISEGYGLYIGDAYFGTLVSHDDVDRVLDSLLNEFRTDNRKESVAFEKDISFIAGKYMMDSFVDENEIIRLLTSTKTVTSYYTAERGDTLALISDKFEIDIEEITALNSGYTESTKLSAGDRLRINKQEPFLNIVITREENYTEPVPFETLNNNDSRLYERDSYIDRTGVNGTRAVTANVSYINGVEVSRQVLTRTVIQEPVTQIVNVGTRERATNAGPPTVIEEGKFVWPVDGGLISYPPGVDGGYAGHLGVDIAAPRGTAIYSAGPGIVQVARPYDAGGYGIYVKILHDNGVVAYYGHMVSISSTVYVGKRVAPNEVIGYVGATGNAYGTHLHFETYKNGKWVDCMQYLPPHAMQSGGMFIWKEN